MTNSSPLAKKILEFSSKNLPLCFIGFDGFQDTIAEVVDSRDAGKVQRVKTISAFAKKIDAAKEKSGNFEFLEKQEKIGGNAPLFALALASFGFPVNLAATVGKDRIDPFFMSLKEKMNEVLPLASPGFSLALEFSDGKIILGRQSSLAELTASDVIHSIGESRLLLLLEKSTLFGSVNWTMLPMMNAFWKTLLKKFIPKLSHQERHFFVDFADPLKRSDKDLKEALKLIQGFSSHFKVTIGLNYSEAERVGTLLKIKKMKSFPSFAKAIQEQLKLFQVAIHRPKTACLARLGKTIELPSLYIEDAAVKTGAGDHFNGGLMGGTILDLSLSDTLKLAHLTSGYYVRKGISPTREELAFFLREWDKLKLWKD